MKMTYKLQILQKRAHDDFPNYVISEIRKAEPDTVLVQAPRRKSIRKMPRPGIKWEKGIISIANGNFRAFANATFHNEYYYIKIVRIEKKKAKRVKPARRKK